jgi:hypothetical protein
MNLFYTADNEPLRLEGLLRGAACFLVASGPSFKALSAEDRALLRSPGLLTMGINNSPAGGQPDVVRPNLWTMVDDVASFVRSIWLDPRVLKFVPHGKAGHELYDSNKMAFTKRKVRDCPGVVYYRRPEDYAHNVPFNAATFLSEPAFWWGNTAQVCQCGFIRPSKEEAKAQKLERVKTCPKCKSPENRWGGRSVMLPAVKIAYALGCKALFLVGVDLNMPAPGEGNYSFAQHRAMGSVKSNQKTYRLLNERFDALRPHFERAKFRVWNCNPDSGLKSFDYISLHEAVRWALSDFPDVHTENTAGLYDRKARERREEKERERAAQESGRVPWEELLARATA